MGAFDLQHILNLSVAQRIELVETVWDSISADAQILPLQDYERNEIEQRLAEHEANPADIATWQEVKTALDIA